LVLVGPRLVLTDRLVGHPLWSGTTDPSINSYAGIVFDNLGWRTDHLSFNSRGELPAVLRERGHTQPDMDDYRLATARTWERHPLETAAVLLHKTYIVWRHPYNDSRRTFLFGGRAQRWLHEAVLALAAIGLPLLLRNWRMGVPLVLTILYMWVTYFTVQIEVRYMVTAVPLMICCAACALTLLGRGWRTAWRTERTRRLWMAALLLLASLLLLGGATIGRLVAPPFRLSPAGAYNLHRGLAILVMLEAAVLAAMLLQRATARRWALAATALPCLAGALIFLVGGSLANLWHQWICPLTAGDAVRQDFVLPAWLPPPARAEVRLDLARYSAGQQDLVVMVDGVEAARFTGGPTLDNAVAPADFYRQIFAGQGRPPRSWHGWYAVPVDPALLANTQQLRTEARVEGAGTVVVFGDYPLDNAAIYDGPSPISPGSIADTSVYKYLGDGDLRMRRRYQFGGKSWSSYFDGQQWTGVDLSPSPGWQYGRYRIVLRLVYPNGQVLIF
jgi:hypothetical protein